MIAGSPSLFRGTSELFREQGHMPGTLHPYICDNDLRHTDCLDSVVLCIVDSYNVQYAAKASSYLHSEASQDKYLPHADISMRDEEAKGVVVCGVSSATHQSRTDHFRHLT